MSRCVGVVGGLLLVRWGALEGAWSVLVLLRWGALVRGDARWLSQQYRWQCTEQTAFSGSVWVVGSAVLAVLVGLL